MPGVTGLGFRDPVPTVGTGPIHVYPTFFYVLYIMKTKSQWCD
jgi:hypothetical protein